MHPYSKQHPAQNLPAMQTKLLDVKACFAHGDWHLGYRRLLDSALETTNFTIYEHSLAFCDWYDTISGKLHEHQTDMLIRVTELLEKIDAAAPKHMAQPPVKLLADGVSKAYSSGSFSLAPISFKLHTSEIIGLVGENGNGKTTLLRLLYGELHPDKGRLAYHFSDTEKHAVDYAAKTRLAFIPQRPAAWYGSLMDNLQFTSTHYGLKGKENYLWTEMIAARLGLRPFRTFSWSRISSGYKMRFELARTLLKRPEILLLDEPLANLDVLAQQIILEDLKYMAQSESMPLSIILSSQQLYEVEKVSDNVIFLQKGVARFQKNTDQPVDAAAQLLVLELETSATREVLQAALQHLGLEKISYNGGVYLLYFNAAANVSQVLQTVGEQQLPIKYLRDISASSRRFFDA